MPMFLFQLNLSSALVAAITSEIQAASSRFCRMKATNIKHFEECGRLGHPVLTIACLPFDRFASAEGRE